MSVFRYRTPRAPSSPTRDDAESGLPAALAPDMTAEQQDHAAPAPPAPVPEMSQRDTPLFKSVAAAVEGHRDVLHGMEFNATMQLRTPLSVLLHHGEIYTGPPSEAPVYGTMADGCWVPKTKTWRELGIDIDEWKPVCASDIGPIDPERYVLFLREFRRIVEGGGTVDEKIDALEQFPQQSEEFAEYWRMTCALRPEFPLSWFRWHLAVASGMGERTVKALWGAGYRTADDVFRASDADLRRIPGIGPKVLQRIREAAPGC